MSSHTTKRSTRQYRDLNLKFIPHPATMDVTKRVDIDAIKTSVKHLVLTRNYERPFHPEIGSQVHSLLFENWTPFSEQLMRTTIENTILKFEPRVRLIEVAINAQPDRNEVEVTITFAIQNVDTPVSVVVVLERNR